MCFRFDAIIAAPLFMAEPQGTLLTGPSLSHEPISTSDEVSGDEKVASPLDKSSSNLEVADEKTQYVNGEPVITSGRDVPRFIVDLRDDQDPPFTFRSVVLGTLIGGLGAAFDQVCHVQYFHKPLRTFTCRSMSSNQSLRVLRRCFYSSSFIYLGWFGQPSCQSVRW